MAENHYLLSDNSKQEIYQTNVWLSTPPHVPFKHVLGALAKLRKATISYVVSVCTSVRVKQLGCHWTDFHVIWYFSIFPNYVGKIQVSLESDKVKVYFTWKKILFLIISRSVLLRMRNVSEIRYGEYQKTQFMFYNIFLKPYLLRDNVQKYCRAGQTTDNNMTHAHYKQYI